MSRSETDYLRHILREADFLAERSAAVSRDAFLDDEILQRAFVRSLEVIGEAAKQLPREWRIAHPEIDWRAMAGMRDRLIHEYFGVDLEIVWEVASELLPALRDSLVGLIETEDR